MNSQRVLRHVFAQGDRVWVRDYSPNAEKWQPGIVQSCMGSLSYNVELEGGYQRKVHVNHLIRQPPAGVPVFKISLGGMLQTPLVDTMHAFHMLLLSCYHHVPPHLKILHETLVWRLRTTSLERLECNYM